MTTPRYRGDIKGMVKENIADCEQQMRSEIEHSDNFVFLPEDTHAWEEYKDTLTEAEMRAAFKRARRVTA